MALPLCSRARPSQKARKSRAWNGKDIGRVLIGGVFGDERQEQIGVLFLPRPDKAVLPVQKLIKRHPVPSIVATKLGRGG